MFQFCKLGEPTLWIALTVVDFCKQLHLFPMSFQRIQHRSDVSHSFSSACVRWWFWRGSAPTEQWGSAQHWRANSTPGCPALTCGTRQSPSSPWRRPWFSTTATPNPPERPCGCSPHPPRTWHRCAASKTCGHTRRQHEMRWGRVGLCVYKLHSTEHNSTISRRSSKWTFFWWKKRLQIKKIWNVLFSVGCFHSTISVNGGKDGRLIP